MKKVFFTAIAMIAFSGASMANTIADEEVVVNNKEKVIILKKDYPCTEQWSQDVDALMEFFDLSLEEADEIATLGFELCLCNTYGGC